MAASERKPEASLQEGIAVLKERYASFKITTPEDFSESAEVIKTIKRQRDAVVEFFRDSKQKAHAAWKSIVAQEKSFTDEIDQVERKIKSAIREYQAEQERKRREEEKRLREIAEAEAKKAQEKLMQQAEEAEKAGNASAAEEITNIAAQVEAAPVQVQSSAPKAQGVSFRRTWEIESVNKAELIKAAANDPNLAAYLIVDESALKRTANALKGQISIPGVTFRENKTVAVRR